MIVLGGRYADICCKISGGRVDSIGFGSTSISPSFKTLRNKDRYDIHLQPSITGRLEIRKRKKQKSSQISPFVRIPSNMRSGKFSNRSNPESSFPNANARVEVKRKKRNTNQGRRGKQLPRYDGYSPAPCFPVDSYHAHPHPPTSMCRKDVS